MPFNLDKCHVLHAGPANQEENYSLLGSALSSVDKERDLGVVITADLKSSSQCIAEEQKAQKILGFIKRVFRYRNKRTVLAFYKALVRPLLEYSAQFWSPVRRIDVEQLEKVQARATKLVPSIRHKGYQRRLGVISDSSPSSRGGLGACSLRPLRSLEVSLGWTRPPCLNCLVTGRGTTVLRWYLPGLTLCSTGIFQRLGFATSGISYLRPSWMHPQSMHSREG